jgi:ASC-1-like (ASCH) protein
MVTYVNVDYNFQSCTTIKAKIAKIDAIINSLFDTALKSVANGDTVEYTLDTGQSKINKIFSSTESVTKAIKEYESIRQMYVNKITSRVVRLVDSKNFNNGNYGR